MSEALDQSNTKWINNTPIKRFDSGCQPFINKGAIKSPYLNELLELEKKRPQIKRLLKDLDSNDMLEWAHLKKGKALRMIEKNKIEDALDLFAEIFCGIEDDNLEEEMGERIKYEIRIPCLHKLAAMFTEADDAENAIKVYDTILENDEDNKEALLKKNLLSKSSQSQNSSRLHLSSKKKKDEQHLVLNISNRRKEKYLEKDKTNKNFKGYELPDESTTTSEEPVETNNENKERILYYDDDLEELKRLGFLKYLFYPFRKGYNYVKDKLGCCQTREEEEEDEGEEYEEEEGE